MGARRGRARLSHSETLEQVAELATRITEAFSAEAEEPVVNAIGSDLPRRLVDTVGARAEICLRALA
jgi:hypothetical protein